MISLHMDRLAVSGSHKKNLLNMSVILEFLGVSVAKQITVHIFSFLS